jgi:outer membrane immunogenic protein
MLGILGGIGAPRGAGMKQLRLPGVVLFVMFGVTSAAAAGSAARQTTSANSAYNALVAPVYNWTGFYVGANLGGSFGRSSTDYTIAGLPFGITSQRMDGVLGGLQAGYNWQMGRGVFGWETDIQATSQKGSSSLIDFIPGTPGTPAIPGTPPIPCIFTDGPGTPCRPGTGIPGTPGTPGTPGIPAVTAVIAYQNKLPWFGTFRGRIGFAPAERWLVYATGGLAYGDVSTSETLNVNGTSVFLNSTAFRLGWTAGAGIERAIANGWIVKFEYLYIDFGSVTDTLLGIAPITPVATHSHVTDNIVRVGFSYGFRPY